MKATKIKIKYIVEKPHPQLGWEMTTGIQQEVEVSLFGSGWMVKGGGWSGWGDTQRLAQLDWLRARLTEDFTYKESQDGLNSYEKHC